jgi:hypothetical protein
MSNFYATLGRILFGAEFRDKMASYAAVAKKKKKKSSAKPKVGTKKKGAAAAKAEMLEREAETEAEDSTRTGGVTQSDCSARFQKRSLSAASAPAKRDREACAECSFLAGQLKKARAELAEAHEQLPGGL